MTPAQVLAAAYRCAMGGCPSCAIELAPFLRLPASYVPVRLEPRR